MALLKNAGVDNGIIIVATKIKILDRSFSALFACVAYSPILLRSFSRDSFKYLFLVII